MPIDASRYFMFRASNGASFIVGRGINDGPTIVSGGAKYSQIDRPRSKSAIQWIGDEPYRMDLPVLFDSWLSKTQASMEADIAKLQQLRHSPSIGVAPPTVYIDGALPVKGAKWVVEDITWGGVVIWRGAQHDGYRLRQDAVVHLLQSVNTTPIAITASATLNTNYVVQNGDTLAAIAAKTGTTVSKLKQDNNIRDPKTIRVSDTLKIF